jgi:hypothetical protein
VNVRCRFPAASVLILLSDGVPSLKLGRPWSAVNRGRRGACVSVVWYSLNVRGSADQGLVNTATGCRSVIGCDCGCAASVCCRGMIGLRAE